MSQPGGFGGAGGDWHGSEHRWPPPGPDFVGGPDWPPPPVGPPSSPSPLEGPHRNDHMLIAVGGGLLAASTVLPWAHVFLLGNLNLFAFASIDHAAAILPWAMVIVGGVFALTALSTAQSGRLAEAAAVTAGIGVVGGTGDFLSLLHAAQGSDGLVTLGIGALAGVASLVLLAMGSIRILRRESDWRRYAAPQAPDAAVTTPRPLDPTPGWKQDPWGAPGRQRYWNGWSWTEHSW